MISTRIRPTQRRCLGARQARRPRRRRGPPAAERRAAGGGALPEPHRRGEPRVLRRALRRAAPERARARRRGARGGRAHGPQGRPRLHVLRRHAPAAEPRLRAGERSAPGPARRAHRRRRSAVARAHLRRRAGAARARHHDRLHHALPRGGREPLRSHRDHGRGPVVACGTLPELLARSHATEVIELRLLAPPDDHRARSRRVEGVREGREPSATRCASSPTRAQHALPRVYRALSTHRATASSARASRP